MTGQRLTVRSTTCRDGCGGPLEFAYAPDLERWLPLDAQVVEPDTHPGVWVVRRAPHRLEAFRLADLATRIAVAKGISEQRARDFVIDMYEAHFDHRETCPARQHRQEKKR